MAHPALVWADQFVAMRALLHALRLLVPSKMPCRAKGMRVRALVRWGGGWWRECKGASVAMWSGGGVSERCHLRGGGEAERERGRGAVACLHAGNTSHVPICDILIEEHIMAEHRLTAAHERQDEA